MVVKALGNLSIGCKYHYQSKTVGHIFIQQIYLLNFLKRATQSPFIFPQNAVYFIRLSFVVHEIFVCYIKDALKFKCSGPVPNG
jgi:hypothetical protein